MRLFVGNLPYELTEEKLKELFTDLGSVISARILLDRDTKRSRGFGFVEMGSEEDGEKAIKELDGSSISGRNLVVKLAHDNHNRERRPSF